MQRVRVAFSKWGDRAHWEFDGELVGEDEHGHWVGAPAGTPVTRPGASYAAPSDLVTLLPRDRAFVATFYRDHSGSGHRDHPGSGGYPAVELYVDVTTVPRWETGPEGTRTVHVVDLDLDVVRGRSGRVWVDDEDEFADHRVRYGYPPEVVRLAATTCDRVLEEVRAGTGPFAADLGRRWLSRRAPTASA